MSGLLTSTVLGLSTIVTVFAAAFPEAGYALAPLFESGNEYAAYTLGLVVTIPGLVALTLVAGLGRD